MEWFRVESVFPESDKVEKLERLHTRLFEKAITMWVFAGCFCSRNSTDGRISERQMSRLVPTIKRPKPVIAALIDCELIEPDTPAAGELTMHDYLDYNPSKAEKEKWRDDNRRRQQDLRDRRSNALRDKESNGVTNGVTNGEVTEGRNGSPFRTGPVRTGPIKSNLSGSESEPDGSQQRKKEKTEKRDGECYAVWCYWRDTLKHPKAKYTPTVKQKINARLNEGYTVSDLKAVVDACSTSPYHQGDNSNGRKYDSVGLLFRNSIKVDEFLAMGAGASGYDKAKYEKQKKNFIDFGEDAQ